jgi:hypothetical protein
VDQGSFGLAGATALKPFSQGTLSKLCGLYSLLNGVQLALYPLKISGAQSEALYAHAVDHLARRRQLKRVLGEGMYEDVWLDLGRAILGRANAMFHCNLALQQTFSQRRSIGRFRAIERIKSDVRKNRPVLLSLGRTLDHYSVVCGHTRTRLKLFDSSGFRYVEAKNVGLGEESGLLHWIHAETTFTLIDEW